MSKTFKDRVAIVTGAASGIGKQVAFDLAQEGASVVLADLNSACHNVASDLNKKGLSAVGIEVNVTDEASVEALIEKTVSEFGKIDILVHSAGIGIEKYFLDTTLDDWKKVIDVDLTGTFLCTKAAAAKMKESRYGRIVTVSSTAGVRGGFRRAAYGAAKGGVIALTKVMAVELSPYGINVNTVAPGAIETELVAQMHSEETRRIYKQGIPMSRYGSPAETSASILFLASEQASYVNGHVLAVDGGFLTAGLMDPDEQRMINEGNQ